MIVPLVGESEWTLRLDGLPVWEPPQRHTLIVAPHPDDETLAVGGLIVSLRACGTRVTVVAVTDGENAYEGEVGLAEVREREQTEALARLGVGADEVVRLRIPDRSVTKFERELTERLMACVTGEMHVIAPWTGDFHPDHEACGRAAAEVARRTGAMLTSYFFWTWHRGTLELLEGEPLVRFPLREGELAAKLEALACHESQLEHGSGEPILPEYLLEPARRHYEVLLPS